MRVLLLGVKETNVVTNKDVLILWKVRGFCSLLFKNKILFLLNEPFWKLQTSSATQLLVFLAAYSCCFEKGICFFFNLSEVKCTVSNFLPVWNTFINDHVALPLLYIYSKYLEAAVAGGKRLKLAARLWRRISFGPVVSVEPATVLRRPPSRKNFQTQPGWALVSCWTAPWRSNDQSHPPSPSPQTEWNKFMFRLTTKL